MCETTSDKCIIQHIAERDDSENVFNIQINHWLNNLISRLPFVCLRHRTDVVTEINCLNYNIKDKVLKNPNLYSQCGDDDQEFTKHLASTNLHDILHSPWGSWISLNIVGEDMRRASNVQCGPTLSWETFKIKKLSKDLCCQDKKMSKNRPTYLCINLYFGQLAENFCKRSMTIVRNWYDHWAHARLSYNNCPNVFDMVSHAHVQMKSHIMNLQFSQSTTIG